MYRLVAFTGAGISKASGIPTFEDMGNLREKLSRDYFNKNTSDFYRVLYQMKQICDKALPNSAHTAIAQYDVPVVTMNIDGLHKRAGSKNVIEVHGNLEHLYCESCRRQYDYSVVEHSFYCEQCNKKLQPNVVLYGDNIPLYAVASKLVMQAEEILVVGTSFVTSTSWIFVDMAKMKGAKVTVINDNAEQKVPKYLKEIFDKAG